MSGLNEKETNLKTLCRRVTAKMDANPVSILNRMEMVPLYQKEEENLVALLEDLNMAALEIFEDHALELRNTKVEDWKTRIKSAKNSLFQYRQVLQQKG